MTNAKEAVRQAEIGGKAAAQAFLDAFNAQDHATLAGTLHYPHVRLAEGRFATVDSPTAFAERSAANESRLRGEGWHHTECRAIEVVHAGADKVHVALVIDRCDEAGRVYNSFDTLWIATRERVAGGDHWGIAFRSSFLRAQR